MNAQNSSPGTRACNADALNDMLRGEISAVETYDQAIATFEKQPIGSDLHHIRDDHQRAVVALRERVTAAGGTPRMPEVTSRITTGRA